MTARKRNRPAYAHPWTTDDARRAGCPVCGLPIPVGTVKAHLGGPRCLDAARPPLSATQKHLLALVHDLDVALAAARAA